MSINVDPPRHHHASAATRQGGPPSAGPISAGQAQPTAGLPVTPSVDGAQGIQQFSSELQSILVSAQHGATDRSAKGAGERLQTLLANTSPGSAQPASGQGGANSMQAVLDRLQNNLTQALQGYEATAQASKPLPGGTSV